MDVMQACRCCLRCPPDKDLTTPYTHLGSTEVYADMLQQCFDIQLLLDENGPCGICSACVGRLRDASDFKLQVQRSQAELQARLGVCLLTSTEFHHTEKEAVFEPEMLDGDTASKEALFFAEPPIKTEIADEDETSRDMLLEVRVVKEEVSDAARVEDCLSQNEAVFEPEMLDGDTASEEAVFFAEPPVKTEIADEDETSRDMLSRVRQQLAMTCSVRLERLRGDEGHTSIHTGQKPYTCEHCGKQFRSKSTIRKHISSTHLSSGPNIFACDFCCSTFQTELLMSEHQKYEHGVTNFMRSKCEYTTDNKNFFLSHSKSLTANNYFKCSQNSYTRRSINLTSIRKHQMTHTGQKPFQCSYCEYRSNRKDGLKNHEMIHTNEKPFQCGLCEYTGRTKSNLLLHQHMHTGKMPFECDQCNYKSAHKSTFLKHLMIHTGDKPFECNYCNCKFRQQPHLRGHLLTHTGEKPFECSHCNYKCSQKSSLKLHLMTHSKEKPFKCSYCNFQSTQKFNLLQHLMIHTGEKPFECNYCNCKFRQQPHLRRHLLTHTGEKPFECSHCNYKCKAKSLLRKHLSIHLGE